MCCRTEKVERRVAPALIGPPVDTLPAFRMDAQLEMLSEGTPRGGGFAHHVLLEDAWRGE